MTEFRPTARRDAKAAKAFLNKAIERIKLHRPVTIVTDKAHSYRQVIREINHHYDPHFDSIRHIDRKWRNRMIQSAASTIRRLRKANVTVPLEQLRDMASMFRLRSCQKTSLQNEPLVQRYPSNNLVGVVDLVVARLFFVDIGRETG